MTGLTEIVRSLGQRPRAVTLFGVPEGYDAATIGSLAAGRWLHVCRDDGRMARFADAHLAGFAEAQLDRYEALLDCADADIFDWVSGRTAPPPEHDHDVTRLLLAHSKISPTQ